MITFDNSKYIWSHAKNPSGYGFWVFWSHAGGEMVASGTLTEAKRIIKQKLSARGIKDSTVYVMP